jgi:hypothetical protein
MGRMADGVLAGRGRTFWDEVRLITRAKISPPILVEGANTEEGINDVFTSKYLDLYNSVPYDVLTMDSFLHDSNGKVRSGCSDYCAGFYDITPAEVTAAIKKLRPHRGDANFELSSNHLIHGGPAMYKYLAHLFNLMVNHSYTPPKMNLSTLVPITKSPQKSASDSSNYRAIALGSVFCKSFRQNNYVEICWEFSDLILIFNLGSRKNLQPLNVLLF